jgi:hypothetical protein
MLNVFIGFDENESLAYHVLAHSIMRRASKPVGIVPLYLPQLRNLGVYTRKRDPKQSTDFTYSRFLTPYLNNTSDISIFMDCDMLCLGDICELENFAREDPYKDVFVAKHCYIPSTPIKFLEQSQSIYPCKNWSSVMVFNGHRFPTRGLTPDYVNTASGMELHQFKWSTPDCIGSLPLEWNHLVGEYAPNPNAKLVHFTLGGPWFPQYANCEFADEWMEEYDAANSCKTVTFY